MTRPKVTIRTTPEDFCVKEVPAYAPSGEGSHLYVHFRKRGLDTLDAVKKLAHALGVEARDAGTAGLKDRHAITEQTASFAWPLATPVPEPAAIVVEGITVLGAARHGNKLRTGHLYGNRFELVLRDVAPEDVPAVLEGLAALGVSGIPNWFGAQRFGRSGDNVEVALSWLTGKTRPPRDSRVKRLQFSAVQSELFHRVLARRVSDATWNRVLLGDLVQHHRSPKMFVSTDPEVDSERAGSGEVSATGPLFGSKMRAPEGVPQEIEREVLATLPDAEALLARWARLGEGARRPLRLVPEEVTVNVQEGSPGSIRVSFMLPKGAYATSVLDAVCEVRDASRVDPRRLLADEDLPPANLSPDESDEEEATE